MNNKILAIVAVLLMLATASCRHESDTLLAYDHENTLSFAGADTSFAAKFDVLWNGLNQNYAIWDYEAKNGLDWDAVYEKYRPEFAALDKRTKDNPVTDDELKELMVKAFSGLHDGHLMLTMKNHFTGNYARMMPSTERNKVRPEYKELEDFRPDISKYVQLQTATTLFKDFYSNFLLTPNQGMPYINKRIKELSAITNPTAAEKKELETLFNLKKEIVAMESLTDYNIIVLKYAYLEIPGLVPFDKGFADEGINLSYGLVNGNIPYLYISGFSLSSYLIEAYAKESFDMTDPATKAQVEKVKKVWQAWFDAIQTLGKEGKLGGVIIDVRNNGGGMLNDYQFALGALLPSGGFPFCQNRFRQGPGRYDYSTIMPTAFPTYEEDHYVVSQEPIVVLANCHSVSMAELTSLGAVELQNARLVGKRTWGGLCALTDNTNYSTTYVGHIGVEDKTPVYCYVPYVCTFTSDGRCLEGIGVTPDIEIDLDVERFDTDGTDNQFERALEYIKNGK